VSILLGLGLVTAALILWPATSRPLAEGAGSAASARAAPGLRLARATRRGRRAERRIQSELADAVALIAAPLRAGVPPALALQSAVDALEPVGPLAATLQELSAAAAAGEGVATVWLHHADLLGSDDLRFLGQAWLLSEQAGAPLVEALARAEEVLRARHRSRERVASAAAGPRASMVVLALLPASGPLMGLAFGLGPADLYLSSWLSKASLMAGTLLGLAAWWWSRAIVRRAVDGGANAGQFR